MLIFGQNIIRKTAMAPPPIIDESAQDSRRAKLRIGVAAALLITAIGILTVLNQRRDEQAPEEPETEKTVEQASISSEDMEAPAAIPEDATLTTTSPLPEETAVVAPPPPPVPGKLPDMAPVTATKTTAAPTLEEESTGASPSALYVASAAKALGKAEMSVATVRPQPQALIQSPQPLPSAPKSFEVQLGVFTDLDNAKQLQTKLAQQGIPSHTETRVQIGPFKSRMEAERAKVKLKALGISAVVLGK